MNPHVILADPLKCSKCNLCLLKCEETHGRIKMKKMDGLPHICLQCDYAPCKEVCRVGAIYLKDNIAIVDEERCVGCKMCVSACPHSAIEVEELLASKCTLCLDSQHLTPGCVEVCPNNVLVISCEEKSEKNEY